MDPPVLLAQPQEPSLYLCPPRVEQLLLQNVAAMGPAALYRARKAFFLGFYSSTNQQERDNFRASPVHEILVQLYGDIRSNEYKRIARDFLHMWEDFVTKFYGRKWSNFEHLVQAFDSPDDLRQNVIAASWLEYCREANKASLIPTGKMCSLQLSTDDECLVAREGDLSGQEDGLEPLTACLGICSPKVISVSSQQDPSGPTAMVGTLLKTTAKSKKLSRKLQHDLTLHVQQEVLRCTRPEILIYSLNLIHEQVEPGRDRLKALRTIAVSLLNCTLRIHMTFADVENIMRAIWRARCTVAVTEYLHMLVQTLINANRCLLFDDPDGAPTASELMARKRVSLSAVSEVLQTHKPPPKDRRS
eukprot:scaffold2404_cov398-Prasinococcus_capsulatus_cf.AAC.44